MREETLARQKTMGIIPADAKLTPRVVKTTPFRFSTEEDAEVNKHPATLGALPPSVKGGKIEIRLNARVTEKGAFGRVLASCGAPSVGIEPRGQERELHVLRPEHRFESR